MKPYVQTYSVVIGSTACNARCPFCVSKMTPTCNVTNKFVPINERNFIKGAKLARDFGATTALITGKGEPTLNKEQVLQAIGLLRDCGYSSIELQTNSIFMAGKDDQHPMFLNPARPDLSSWYDAGLNTVCISCVDVDTEKNREIYSENYPPLENSVKLLHSIGLSVRLCCMATKGRIDNMSRFNKVIQFCKENKVEQLTIRPLNAPTKTMDNDVQDWVYRNNILDIHWLDIKLFFEENATPLNSLVHGAKVYDYQGQNICLSTCLTSECQTNEIRQIIYFPDGHIRYDWCYEGAIIF